MLFIVDIKWGGVGERGGKVGLNLNVFILKV